MVPLVFRMVLPAVVAQLVNLLYNLVDRIYIGHIYGIVLLRKIILLVPLALTLPRLMGVRGVFAAEAISDATAAVCCTVLFLIMFPRILRKNCSRP